MNQALTDMIGTTHLDGSSAEIITRFVHHLKYNRGKDQYSATPLDCYLAFATTIRDILLDRWLVTQPAAYHSDRKRVYYLSMEYLIGRSLGNAIINLDLQRQSIKALSEMGFDLSLICELEWDAGLGNGGLGRLAACFLDSMATLEIPAYGYGIRYEYGIFFQRIKNGEQIETPDNWLRYGSVWEIQHPEHLFPVYFGGHVQEVIDDKGHKSMQWIHSEYVMAMACDYLIPGYKNGFVNTLRLWSANSTRDFNLSYFNEGDYVQAVADKNNSEMISKVLYPNDNKMCGKELRLKQEYFFVSATLQDILRRFAKKITDLNRLPEFVAIQLNDTHPAIAIAELMRVLVDEKKLNWESAWEITQRCFAYTNHTILPEALEKWQVDLFHRLLPRHLQIIYEINHRFLYSIRLTGNGDDATLRNVSLIVEEPIKSIRMAHLAIVGSHSVNGVSELHTQILKDKIFKDFHHIYPERFNSKTNGITPRRWLFLANPRLTDLITKAIGETWLKDIEVMTKLNDFAGDSAFLEELGKVKQANKEDFAAYYWDIHHRKLDPESIFDFQAKRIHEYKRQLLNALHIIHLIHRIRDGKGKDMHPHTFFFAGKAAPGYYIAKLIIRFICAIAAYVEKDKDLLKLIRIVFLQNYRVSLAERIMPASEISQQISTAGTEASGTGNMKFAINGALTVGTLDGANIEIRQAVGEDNFFLFGMKDSEVQALKQSGYHPYGIMNANETIKRIFDFITADELSPLLPGLFQPLVNRLLYQGDDYCIIADLLDYIRVMENVDKAYLNRTLWNKMSLANIANMGRFSSDETIKRYATEIWGVK
ncbi:MAG: glycogen/starch/alpha-glucan phosphorylase [Candidatus Cloacimonadaceae bacterium]|nr:glycogen/starch/alpha-glucan phosphorylase [Candidatus Cloacimonadaceae bacterium]